MFNPHCCGTEPTTVTVTTATASGAAAQKTKDKGFAHIVISTNRMVGGRPDLYVFLLYSQNYTIIFYEFIFFFFV